MTLSDLSDIDLNNLGGSPLPIKALILVLIAASLGFAGYWFDVRHKITELERVQAEEPKLKQTFERKQQEAANLEDYRKQLVQMEETFGSLLRQLPSKKEVENLIVDVTQAALANGLENEQIQPLPEIDKNFYAVLPYKLRLHGGYHELAAFVSDTAALPRIVTLHDFKIESGDDSDLAMEITAQTYRYIDGSEDAEEEGSASE